LHGYENPWPAGGRVNKFDKTYLSDFANYTTEVSGYYYTDKIQLKANTAYIIKATDLTALSSGIYYVLFHVEGNDPDSIVITQTSVMYPVYNGEVSSNVAYMKFTTGETGVIRFGVKNVGNLAEIMTKEWQLQEGSTATDWTPYSNICPISGHTGAEIEQTGVNVWDEEWELGGINDTTGEPNVSTTAQFRSMNYIPCTPNTEYFAYYNGGAGGGVYVYCYDANKSFLGRAPRKGTSVYNVANDIFTTIEKTAYMLFKCQPSVSPITNNKTVSINYPATDMQYHPYTGNQISVTFPETIYGGEDEVVSGKLDSKYSSVTVSSVTALYGQKETYQIFRIDNALYSRWHSRDVRCNMLKRYYSVNDLKNSIGFSHGDASASVYVSLGADINTIAEANAFLSNYPLQFVCELAEPVEYTLEGHDLTTLYGTNNIWVDTGDVTVTYIAKSAKFSFHSPLHTYNFVNLKLFGNTYIEHGKG